MSSFMTGVSVDHTNNDDNNNNNNNNNETQFWTGSFIKNPDFGCMEFYIRYIISIRSVIDLLCIIPLFVQYASAVQSIQLNFLRIFRVFALLKLLKSLKTVRPMLALLYNTLDRSHNALVLMVLVSVMVTIFFGSIIYSFEKGAFTIGYTSGSNTPYAYYQVPTADEMSTQMSLYSSAPAGVWFAYFSVLTVGYGDIVPTTVGSS